jgi:hypothetical protein
MFPSHGPDARGKIEQGTRPYELALFITASELVWSCYSSGGLAGIFKSFSDFVGRKWNQRHRTIAFQKFRRDSRSQTIVVWSAIAGIGTGRPVQPRSRL